MTNVRNCGKLIELSARAGGKKTESDYGNNARVNHYYAVTRCANRAGATRSNKNLKARLRHQREQSCKSKADAATRIGWGGTPLDLEN